MAGQGDSCLGRGAVGVKPVVELSQRGGRKRRRGKRRGSRDSGVASQASSDCLGEVESVGSVEEADDPLEESVGEPPGEVDYVVGRRAKEEINMQGTLKNEGDRLNVTILLDTGADRSFINERLLEAFPSLTLDPTHLNVRTLSGERVPTAGSALLELEISGSKISHEFIFMPMTEDVVMGMDLIAGHCVEWSWRDRRLHIGDREVPCAMPSKIKKKSVRVRVRLW